MALSFKASLLLIIFCLIILSCTNTQPTNEENLNDNVANNYALEITKEQEAAFNALNKLQLLTDEKNKIYSTFPNLNQASYPADTTLEISQTEFLQYMQMFVAKHCKNLATQERNQLAKAAVLVQEKYTVLYSNEDNTKVDFEKGLPTKGTWVLPSLLGRRDLVLVW